MRKKTGQFLFVLIMATIFCVSGFVYADGLSWSQDDWSGGSGQDIWSDATKYKNDSGVAATRSGLTLQTNSNWHNALWKYRQSVSVINNSGADLNDYQIPIFLNTVQLINNGRMESDCRDIRVVDSSGTVLPLWIATSPAANACNQTATKIWVKLESLPAAGTSLSLYYGNQDASSSSNGNEVFPIFSDFTIGSSLPNGWTQTDIGTTGSAAIGGGALSISNTNGEDVWQKTYGATHVYSTSTVSNSFIAESLLNSQTNSDPWAKTGITVQNTVASGVGNGQAFIVATPGNGIAFQYQSQTGELCPGGICEPGIIAPNSQTNSGSASFPLFLKLTKDGSNQVSGYYSSDGSSWSQEGEAFSPWGASSTQYVTLFVTPHFATRTSTATYSFFYVRSYSASEPTVGVPQNEESPYLSTGNLVSSVYDMGGVYDFGSASYSYLSATNTNIVLKIRTSDFSDMTGAGDFSLCNPISSGSDISSNNCVADRKRYVQYQVSFSSSDNLYTPTFANLSLDYSPTPAFTLSYSASLGGYISGSSTQILYYDDSGSSVAAHPMAGYYFYGWDDNNKESSRADLNVKANFSALAKFLRIPSSSFVPPSTPAVLIQPSFSNEAANWLVNNVYQMAISENADFSKSSWEPYYSSYQNKDKSFFIKFRSQDGGESKVYFISPEKNSLATDSKQAIAPVVKTPTPQVNQVFKFERDLKLGAENTDVKELQKFLNRNNFLVAARGNGSPGKESAYFGNMTKAALIKFQKANNIYPAFGFFGPITRKVITERMSK